MSGLLGGRCTARKGCSWAVLTDEGLLFSTSSGPTERSPTRLSVKLKCSTSSLRVCVIARLCERPPAVTPASRHHGVRAVVRRVSGSGGRSEANPPVPIPHTAVKRPSADDTLVERPRDNRSPPGHL